jgi:hypothetical protein
MVYQHSLALILAVTVILIIASGCEPASGATPLPAPTPRLCGPFEVPAQAYLACAIQGEDLLVQTQAGQTVALTQGTLSWTIAGTVLYAPRADSLTQTLVTLEGTALVSVKGSTRIVPAGAQVILSLDETGAIHSLSPQPLPYDGVLVDIKLIAQLPRPLTLPTAIALPESYEASITQDNTRSPGIGVATVQVACQVRDEWGEAEVKAGENLSMIAARYGLTAVDLQQANCLNNPNQLRIGQVLHVPPYSTTTPYAQATFTPSVVAFRADVETLAPGECTTLRWDVQNISAVFLDEQTTTGSGVLPICPTATITYTLRVVYPDGTQAQYPLMISVVRTTPTPSSNG